MDVTTHEDGGATLRLSHVELVRYYNLVNASLQNGTWLDGTPIPLELLTPQWQQLRQLAQAVGVPDPGAVPE
jgi:hypothetical protein